MVTHWGAEWLQYDNLALTNENDDPETGRLAVANAPEVNAVFYFPISEREVSRSLPGSLSSRKCPVSSYSCSFRSLI